MKRLLLMLFFFPGLFLLNACAPRTVTPPDWIFERDAIHLTLRADHDLNWYNDASHTLQLCVYQLKDPNGFNQLAQSEDGLYALLECSVFDGSVANYKRVIMHPGEETFLKLDRAERAKYIGLAAGYAEMQKENIIRLIDIPVIEEKEGGVFRKRWVAKPDTLDAILRLAPHQIETGIGD